ncbi:MAG TPA: hypothetical protein VGG41_03960 [Solirubrobacteraceae bacterium]|jgi:hypothetical protein
MAVVKTIRQTSAPGGDLWDAGHQQRDGVSATASTGATTLEVSHEASVARPGIGATAAVISAINKGSMTDAAPVIELVLRVGAQSGLPPYEATVAQPIPQLLLPLVRPGSRLAVKVARSDPQAIWIDFATEPD